MRNDEAIDAGLSDVLDELAIARLIACRLVVPWHRIDCLVVVQIVLG